MQNLMFVKAFVYLFENWAILFSFVFEKLGPEFITPGQLFSAVLLFSLLCLNFFAVVDKLSAFTGGKDYLSSEAGDVYSAV